MVRPLFFGIVKVTVFGVDLTRIRVDRFGLNWLDGGACVSVAVGVANALYRKKKEWREEAADGMVGLYSHRIGMNGLDLDLHSYLHSRFLDHRSVGSVPRFLSLEVIDNIQERHRFHIDSNYKLDLLDLR